MANERAFRSCVHSPSLASSLIAFWSTIYRDLWDDFCYTGYSTKQGKTMKQDNWTGFNTVKPFTRMCARGKGDKLDVVALGFENRTTAIFDECITDKGFRKLFIDNASESISFLINTLSDYAESNLI